ncbi:MAG: HNH endonuclease signature motif containing protein [Candidatus Krumholzibacteriia bacterium]
MNPTQPMSAAQVHGHLTHALTRADGAQGDAALWFSEVARRHLDRALGHASLDAYAREALDFSDNRLAQFRQLADALERLPALRTALADRRLGWTKAQQVARVATPGTCDRWLARAEQLGRRELARAVRAARESADRKRARRRDGQLEFLPGAPPAPSRPAAPSPPCLQPDAPPSPDAPAPDPVTTITFQLDGLERARYEALVESLRKRGHGGTRTELLLTALAALASDGTAATTAPVTRIVMQRCPECQASRVVTGAGTRRLTPAQAAAAACDAEVVDPTDGQVTRTIAPTLRRRVLARDDHRCRAPGCRSTRFLDVHHIVPRHRGGSNRLENLITLCSRCHRFLHTRVDACAGASAQDLAMQWVNAEATEPSGPATPASGTGHGPATIGQAPVARGSGGATMP